MFNYITEPKTNKKYSIFSKNGKQLLKKYVQLLKKKQIGGVNHVLPPIPPTCQDYVMFDYPAIQNYLANDINNFVIVYPNGTAECENLQDLRIRHRYDHLVQPAHPDDPDGEDQTEPRLNLWFACNQNNGQFHQNNINFIHNFIKIGSTNTLCITPNWYNFGGNLIPNQRIFYLQPRNDINVPSIVSRRVIDGNMLVGTDHCQNGPRQVYELVPIPPNPQN